MKKIFLIALVLFTILLYCSCAASEPNNRDIPAVITGETVTQNTGVSNLSQYEFVFKHASRMIWPKGLSGMEEKSDMVVKVTVLEGAVEIRANEPDLKQGITPDSHFLTPVRIEAIYKNDNKGYKVGDIINIEEYYATAPSPTDENVIVIFSSGFYVPMVTGEQYILFLAKPQFDGDYLISYTDLGKYLYNETVKNAENIAELSNKELEVGDVDIDDYYSIAAEVMEKYGQR